MLNLYHDVSYKMSRKLTNSYSTSFSFGIRAFTKEYRDPIYAVYAYVRLADEIVDSFHGYDKASMLSRLRTDTYEAVKSGISVNPVLHAFQLVVNKYGIDAELIDAFLDSMEMDLHNSYYGRKVYDDYIYGSAEVVGLMCLKVFVDGNEHEYRKLVEPARMLGSAFQKVNFLRDIKSDLDERGRIYLPDVENAGRIDDHNKQKLENEIDAEFKSALRGIMKLPAGVKLGVYSAYLYYFFLFKKIRSLKAHQLLSGRVRISNFTKLVLFLKSYFEVRILGLS